MPHPDDIHMLLTSETDICAAFMHHMLNITILVTSDDPAFLLLCLTLLDYGGNLANPGVDYFKMIFWAVIRI